MLAIRSIAAGLILSGFLILVAPYTGFAMVDLPHFISFVVLSLGTGLFVGSIAYWFAEQLLVRVIGAIGFLLKSAVQRAGHALTSMRDEAV